MPQDAGAAKVVTRKKLIEVSLPLDAINKASTREKSLRHGHPSTLHLWWARRPLATARAVIFSQMVDDPSSHPEEFPTGEDQDRERQRLFRLIEQLVLWENTTNETVLQHARDEILKSWRSTCADNMDHPQADELFNPEKLPAFHDPFAGGGALPLEAQRLGLEIYASDLNPVAVLINKAMIEIPPKFAGQQPVNPGAREAEKERSIARGWKGAQGLADDVRYYGQWMRDEAEKRIGNLYPNVEVTAEMVKERPDLNQYAGKKLTVIAWLWARTVKSPNPAFAQIDVPLASTFVLSTKEGKEAYVEPVIENGSYRFKVRVGTPRDAEGTNNGTKSARANFKCILSGTPVSGDYIKGESRAGRMGVRLMAIVAEGRRERVFLDPSSGIEAAAINANPTWKPETDIIGSSQYIGVKPYGMDQFSDLFTNRQLVALETFSDLAQEAHSRILNDAVAAGLCPDSRSVDGGGIGASSYADAVAVYLSIAVDKAADYWSMLCFWHNAANQLKIVNTFGRQALSMTWDFAEGNPFSVSSGHFLRFVSLICEVLEVSIPARGKGLALQHNAAEEPSMGSPTGFMVSTDPPYFDNVPYADLSDFFYVWLRRSLRRVYPELFATVAVPKSEELVAFAYRHENKVAAGEFFLDGMGKAMRRLADLAHPEFPVTIYYAFRQSESNTEGGRSSTGWETFLDAVIRSGFAISGTWPMRTEYTGNLKAKRNALASSIILVCRKLAADAPTATRREFVIELKDQLPAALTLLQAGNIAPVDLAQAAIGPGMQVYTRYSQVLNAEGKPITVREALAMINQILDETLAEREGDFDAESRWALTWFEESGFAEGDYGIAEQLSKSKNTSVEGMVASGILESSSGKVRLFRPDELPENWDPATDVRTPAWESLHQLVHAMEEGGDQSAAALVSKLGAGRAEVARELAYRLYTICDRKSWAKEALSYNSLVQSWPEILGLSQNEQTAKQGSLL